MGLLAHNLRLEGEIIYQGKNIIKYAKEAHRQLRINDFAMIFQEPMTALNPSINCGEQVFEKYKLAHPKSATSVCKNAVIELFEKTKLPDPERIYNSYPHQLSGGQKQRVMISMALAGNPKLLIADEPTTALDATVQREILALIKQLQQNEELTVLFISHDLDVVKGLADDVLVLFRGEVKEYGTAQRVFNAPDDLYTKALLACKTTYQTYDKRLPLVQDRLAGNFVTPQAFTSAERLQQSKALSNTTPLLKIADVNKTFSSKQGFNQKRVVKASQHISIDIFSGESLGLVGESGSGKSTLGRILAGLDHADSGSIFFEGEDIAKAGKKKWKQLHKDIQLIFQDPAASLPPRLKVGKILEEVLCVNRKLSKTQAKDEAITLLQQVGLASADADKFPHEFSGGQKQRIGIARALAVKPKFIVCDESVSALDVSVQAQILNLLNDLKEAHHLTYLFISHDLNVVKYFCDRIVVLKDGELIETGFSEQIYKEPKTDYTKKLLHANSY